MRALALLVLFAGAAGADTVWLRDGTSVTGKILSESADEISIKVAGGAQRAVRIADALLVEFSDRHAAKAGFDRLRRPATADALVEAARYAYRHGLVAEGDSALGAALELDPQHAGAKAAKEDAARTRLLNPKDDAAILKKYGDGWRLHVGRRYRLVTNVDAKPEDFDHKLVAMIDAFWDFYCETFGLKPEQKQLHNIVCYATRQQFDDAPGAMKGAYGVYQHGDPFRPAVLWYMEGLRGSSFTTRHECGHQFVAHYVRPDGEPWFGEGIATTFECQGDVPFQDHLYRWQVVHETVLDKGGFTVANLVKNSGAAGRDQIYCLGAAVHLFFLTGKDKAYREAYQKFLSKGNTKDPEALAKAVGRPLGDLETEFVDWVKELDAQRKIFPPAK